MKQCCKCGLRLDFLKSEHVKTFEGKPYCLECWNIGKPKEMETIEPLKLSAVTKSNFEKIGYDIGKLVEEKNRAYGDSFNKCGEFLKILYPNGVSPDQYTDLLGIARVFDKLMRIANKKDAFEENPWNDIAGYGILKSGLDWGTKQKEDY